MKCKDSCFRQPVAQLRLVRLPVNRLASAAAAHFVLVLRSPNAFWIAKAEAGSQNAPMSSQASGLRVASVIFALFAVGHVVRLVKQAQVTVGTYQIPMWVSVVALIIAAILSTWMWRLSSARD